MFGMSGTELAIVLVLALLLLGPSKMPELARSLGKAVRDFKRATGDIRSTVESEFYRMDKDPLSETKPPVPPAPSKAQGIVASGGASLPAQPEGKVPDPYVEASADANVNVKGPETLAAEAKAKQLEKDLAAPAAAPAAPSSAPAPDAKPPEPKS